MGASVFVGGPGPEVSVACGTAIYPANVRVASARARLRADGTALVQAGTQDLGTGTYTVMTQIAAATLGLPIEQVTFELGDAALPETPVSGGSQSTATVGSAVKLACLELRNKLARLAVIDPESPLHGLPADSLDAGHGELFPHGDASTRDPSAHIITRSGQTEVTVEIEREESPDRKGYSCHSFGADVFEVRVDEQLGRVRVARIVAAFGAGRCRNPKTARSELIGGLVWAVGMALEEHTVRDRRTARPVTRDLADYHVPVNADIPAMDVIMIDELDPHVNEAGVKGIGEIGICGATAAIANAIYHATGKRIRDLPITLDKLL